MISVALIVTSVGLSVISVAVIVTSVGFIVISVVLIVISVVDNFPKNATHSRNIFWYNRGSPSGRCPQRHVALAYPKRQGEK